MGIIMETKYFVNSAGDYLGGFCGAIPPEGAIEVPTAPNHGTDKYVDGQWQPSHEFVLATVREQRTKKLEYADVQINKLEDAGKDTKEWRSYRQALRDITKQPINAIVWPEAPHE